MVWNALELEGEVGEGMVGALREEHRVCVLGLFLYAHSGGNKCIMECIILCSVLQWSLA